MKRLEGEIETCKEGGMNLETKLKGWAMEVEEFQGIVNITNGLFRSPPPEIECMRQLD